jgi:hypothetical protein
MEKLRNIFESTIFSYISDSIIVAQHFQGGRRIDGDIIDSNTYILAIARSFQFEDKKLFSDRVDGFSSFINVNTLRHCGNVYFMPPKDRSILITIICDEIIIEVICSEIRFGESFSQFHINLVEYKFLSAEQEVLYPDLIEIINIVHGESNLYFKSPGLGSTELGDRPALCIRKIELLKSDEELKSNTLSKTKFPSKLSFIGSKLFDKGERTIIINSGDRSVTIVDYHTYEKCKKCGFDGTLFISFRDEHRYKTYFKTYFQLCLTFDIPYVYHSDYSLNYLFTIPIEILNSTLEVIEDEEGY